MEWIADYGKTSRCCQSATDAEIEAAPERYDCERCARAEHWAALWPVNRDAWTLYGRLGSRVVRDLEVQGWYLAHLTAGWASEDVLDLVARLDVMQAILHPEERPDRG